LVAAPHPAAVRRPAVTLVSRYELVALTSTPMSALKDAADEPFRDLRSAVYLVYILSMTTLRSRS
jgi:hypothetical protein